MIFYCSLSFLAGMIFMDLMWGWKTGTVQRVVSRIRGR